MLSPQFVSRSQTICLAACLASVSVMLACGDKSDDTGCDECPEGNLDPLEPFDINADDNCEANSGGHVTLGVDVKDFEVDGLDEGDVSGSPPSGSTVRAKRLSGPCAPAASSWCEANGSTESGETWTTNPACSPETSDTGFLSLSNCWGTGYASGEDPCGAASAGEPLDEESCDGLYAAEILVDEETCSDYDPARIELDLGVTYDARTSPEATCTAGSGRFVLFPRYLNDVDNDGEYQGVFDAVQISGTGKMRRADWVTEIELVEDNGNDLRVLKAGQTGRFNRSDQLLNANTVSAAITGTHMFSTGVIPGYPLFTANEIGFPGRWSMEVDMEWSCNGSPTTLSGLPTGYIVPTETIGCDAVQDLVLRVLNSPNRVHIEQYGYPQHKIVVPTTTTPSGRRFVHEWNFFRLDATVESWNGSSATVRIDEMTWDGVDVCEEDTYVFQAE